MRTEDDDVDVDHSKLVIGDGRTAYLSPFCWFVYTPSTAKAVPPHGSRRS